MQEEICVCQTGTASDENGYGSKEPEEQRKICRADSKGNPGKTPALRSSVSRSEFRSDKCLNRASFREKCRSENHHPGGVWGGSRDARRSRAACFPLPSSRTRRSLVSKRVPGRLNSYTQEDGWRLESAPLVRCTQRKRSRHLIAPFNRRDTQMRSSKFKSD